MNKGNSLSMETIRRMRETWKSNPSYSAVARACGVDRDTVRRYALQGNPRLGVAPFVEGELSGDMDLSQVDYHRKLRRLLTRLMLAADRALDSVIATLNGEEAQANVRLTDVSKSIELLSKLGGQRSLWADAPEASTDNDPTDPTELFKDKRPSELGFFADFGRFPTASELADYEAEQEAQRPETHLPPPPDERH